MRILENHFPHRTEVPAKVLERAKERARGRGKVNFVDVPKVLERANIRVAESYE